MDAKTHFTRTARWLHWAMAAMILAMLFIGVGMVASLELRPLLIDIHRPLGLLVLGLAVLRLWHRRRNPPPPLPGDLPAVQAAAARASHWLLYALMLAMPLLGWAMSSAGGYLVTLPGGWVLPALAPQDAALYATLRAAHGLLGYAFFAVVLAHIAGALHHAWVRRDGVFRAMAGGGSPSCLSGKLAARQIAGREAYSRDKVHPYLFRLSAQDSRLQRTLRDQLFRTALPALHRLMASRVPARAHEGMAATSAEERVSTNVSAP